MALKASESRSTAPNTIHARSDCIDMYNEIYDSAQNQGHTLCRSEVRKLYECFKKMIAIREVFYFCKHCKVLAVSKRRCYNHQQHAIIQISKMVSRQKFESDIAIQNHLKIQFGIIDAFRYKDQRIILFPFDESKNCQDNLWLPTEKDIKYLKPSFSVPTNKLSKKTTYTAQT